MVIDVAFVILIIIAIFKGFTKGLIVGVFSFLALIIGLAAAIKLSAIVAIHLQTSSGITGKWLPLISFFLVFMAVVFLVNIGAALLKKTVNLAMLGWVDKAGGILFYACIYTIIFSVILFYAEKTFLIKPETVSSSSVHNFVAPWGPEVINHLGKIIPVFKDLFSELQSFFETLGHNIAA